MPEPLIRSVFNQYPHTENRLTNALVQVLLEDVSRKDYCGRIVYVANETKTKAAR